MANNSNTDNMTARERLLAAARVLFYDRGIAATGIDMIIERAGVARKSLYNNFGSKAELIAEYIELRHQEWLELFRKRERRAKSPVERILAVFKAYIDHAGIVYEQGFRGCGLLNAAAEFPAGASAREAIRRHKEEIEEIIFVNLKHLAVSGSGNRRLLARHLSFLLEGAVIRGGLEGRRDALVAAEKIARDLLEGYNVPHEE